MPEPKKRIDEDLIAAAFCEARGLGGLSSAPPAAAGTPIVATIPGYHIRREIHRGGQGVVFEATSDRTERRVAIKVLRDGPLATDSERARFDREVRILGQLRHPNIVTVHDRGTAGGQQYFVMDYVDGHSLDVWLQGRRWSARQVVELFVLICGAVQSAHVRGIQHRDLKPGNIRVSAEGDPHVLDFGLARDVAPTADTVTEAGQFVGSLPWASPEQVLGDRDRCDLRTDVYSLGIMLYQALCGTFPYEVVGNVADVVERIRHTVPVRPRRLRGDLDLDLETIVLVSLQKDPARRYQTAGELAAELRRYLAGEAIVARRDSFWYLLRKGAQRHRLAFAMGFALIVSVNRVARKFGDTSLW